MAETYKILAKKASSGIGENVLYSTSAGKETIVTNITVANTTSSTKTFDIHVVNDLLTNQDLVGAPGFSGTKTMYREGLDAFADSSTFKISTDEITWVNGTFPRSERWKNFNNIAGNYVAFYDNASNSVDYAVSTDAVTWTTNSLPGGPYNMSYPVKKINGKLIISPGANYDTYEGLGSIFSTTDLVTWNSGSLPNPNSSPYKIMRSLNYGNGIYFGVGSENSIYYKSTDLITWDYGFLTGIYPLSTSVFVNGNFIIRGVDEMYTEGVTFTSTDAVTWVQSTVPNSSTSFYSFKSNGSIALLYDNLGFHTTTDGITWSDVTPPFAASIEAGSETQTSCNGDTFVFSIRSTGGMTTPAVGYYTSTDLTTWTTVSTPTTSLFNTEFMKFGVTDFLAYESNPVNALYKGVSIAGNTSKVLEPGIVLGPENTILNKGEFGLTFSAYGVELS